MSSEESGTNFGFVFLSFHQVQFLHQGYLIHLRVGQVSVLEFIVTNTPQFHIRFFNWGNNTKSVLDESEHNFPDSLIKQLTIVAATDNFSSHYKLGAGVVSDLFIVKQSKQNMTQNNTALAQDQKGKAKMGQGDTKPSQTKNSPSSVVLPAQRLVSKAEDKNKRVEVRMTQASREINGLRLYNQFTALDSLNDHDWAICLVS